MNYKAGMLKARRRNDVFAPIPKLFFSCRKLVCCESGIAFLFCGAPEV